ncbi:hypothetical protein EOPP23_08760 [Endozoicomonas sp. OPT23]|uniref:bifunctional diguanylate cyclase/phosphodiesterase n=1 Tax=Endozoicomonas sp. OPT23 TaxID=2072845 RepID=UPI00129A85D2|nr:EAL domain-containing protein [Endozoicomonas sp. OPT23]MRI33073.1 hypothetical protein [Endozoicomonas sp. OPT23]
MTLLRELAVYLTIMLCLLFGGSLLVNINDARSYLQAQLESHAQDTATSLGVAIAATEPDNIAVIDSMIDAVFDRGYYQTIRFEGPEGKTLVLSENDLALDGVPGWFVGMASLSAPEVSSEINNGWVKAGTLYVTSHPGVAYRSLWSKTQNAIWLFGGTLLLVIAGLNILLNIVLRPLGRLEKQADAICQKRFEVQDTLPRTKDIRRVVEAMNRMVTKLEHLFNEKVVLTEDLRRQSVKDSLTGVLNQRTFDDRIAAALGEDKGIAGGALLILQVSGLEQYNRDHGRKAADQLLTSISKEISESVQAWQEAIVGRRSGSEFAVFIPASDRKQAELVSEFCFTAVSALSYFASEEGKDKLHIGMAVNIGHISREALINQADQILRAAQHQGSSCWLVQEIENSENQPYRHWDDDHWQTSLKQVLAEKELELFAQPVYSNTGQLMFKEVFARLRLLGELAAAEAFLPMVERFDLHSEFDKVVFEVLSEKMIQHQAEDFCMNFSPRSLLNSEFRSWLLAQLKASPEVARRVILEIPERTLLVAGEKLAGIIREFQAMGCKVSVDHFGIASRCLSCLQTLPLDYIKVDGSYVRGIASNQGNQFYIRTLAMLAESQDVNLLAQNVEEEADWLQLQELGVQGGQGYFLGRPERL